MGYSERMYKLCEFIAQGDNYMVRTEENIIIKCGLIYIIHQEEPIVEIGYLHDMRMYTFNLEGGDLHHLPKNRKGSNSSLREEAASLQKVFSFIEWEYNSAWFATQHGTRKGGLITPLDFFIFLHHYFLCYRGYQ